jgi:hypothetical protein
MKRRGRPPLERDEATTRTSTRLTVRQFDALCRHARAERITLSDVLRRALDRELRPPKIGAR